MRPPPIVQTCNLGRTKLATRFNFPIKLIRCVGPAKLTILAKHSPSPSRSQPLIGNARLRPRCFRRNLLCYYQPHARPRRRPNLLLDSRRRPTATNQSRPGRGYISCNRVPNCVALDFRCNFRRCGTFATALMIIFWICCGGGKWLKIIHAFTMGGIPETTLAVLPRF
ncbi:hypothetical protein DFJ73DRAFT_824583 [Zopfochytrium polystomum]|nr:hypothetical protein DFJ73DRAFT_824583 [Zopfochytrium polystomum]